MAEKRDLDTILGEPIFDDFTEHTLRIRRNLLAISVVALFYKLNDLQIEGGQVFGIKFAGLTSSAIDHALFWLLTYQLIHFAWNGWGHLLRWSQEIGQ